MFVQAIDPVLNMYISSPSRSLVAYVLFFCLQECVKDGSHCGFVLDSRLYVVFSVWEDENAMLCSFSGDTCLAKRK